MGHPPRIPVWLPLDKRVIYFLTLCVHPRKPVLANPMGLRALESAVAKLTQWHVYSAVIMPDHLHLLVAPVERELAVGNCSAAIKRWMRQELQRLDPALTNSWQWQPGCFDRLLRSDESVTEKRGYMRENPERAKLVRDWRDWPYFVGFKE